MYNPLVKAAAGITMGENIDSSNQFNDDTESLDNGGLPSVSGLRGIGLPNAWGKAWARPSTYKKMWDDAKQSAARKRALNAAGGTSPNPFIQQRLIPQHRLDALKPNWGGTGIDRDLADLSRAVRAQARINNNAATARRIANGVNGSITGGGNVDISSGFNGTMPSFDTLGSDITGGGNVDISSGFNGAMPGQDEFDAATEKAKAESKLYDKLMGSKLNPLNWTYGGTPAQPAPSTAPTPAPQGRVGFADDIGNLGLWEAILKHLPGWGKWLGANTMVDGVPNWALGLGGLAAGGLGLAGLNSLLSKSASARAMQAEDPTLMGTVTPARPTITTGNGMSRLMSIISNGCECNCNYGSNMPKSASQNKPNLVTKTTPRSLVPTGPKYGKPTSVDDTAAFNEIPDSTERTARQRDTWRDQQRNAYYERKNNVFKGISGNFPWLNGRMLQIDPEDDSLYYKDKDGYVYNY